MIWYLFAVFLASGFFLILLGYSQSEILYQMLGFVLLFLMGVALISGVEYKTGETQNTSFNDTYTYGNNFTGYHWDYDTGTAPDGPQTDAYLFHATRTEITTTSTQYATLQSFTIGFYLAVISVLGFILSLIEYRGGRRS